METLRSLFRTTDEILALSLADLTDEAARTRLRGGAGASIAWTIGHLLDHRYKVLSMLGDTRPNPWTAQFGAKAATDGSDYPPLAELRQAWSTLHQEIDSGLRQAGRRLDAPVGIGDHGEANVRDRIAFLAWHEGYHTGVIGACRKALGLLGPAELVQGTSNR